MACAADAEVKVEKQRHASGDACAATHQRRELGGVESTEHAYCGRTRGSACRKFGCERAGAVQAGSIAEQEGWAEEQRTLDRVVAVVARWAHAPNKM